MTVSQQPEGHHARVYRPPKGNKTPLFPDKYEIQEIVNPHISVTLIHIITQI